MRRILFIALTGFLFAAQLSAFQAHPGFVKVELTWANDVVKPIPAAELLARFGGEDVADYGNFHVVYLPKGLLTAFEHGANGAGLRLRVRDELDRIDAPGASVDARDGVQGGGNLIRSYPATQTGLYVLQFAGPTKSEWSDAIRGLGWTVVQYLPSNAYVVAGRPALVAPTKALPFVQFVDFYHPFEKAAGFARTAGDVIVEVSPVDGNQQTIAAIEKLSWTKTRVEPYANDVYVHASLAERDATQLLSDPLVIGIAAEPVMRLSDERVAMSLTTNVTSNGSAPTTPGGYQTWITSNCGFCQSTYMPSATWRVGTADTGLDAGSTGTTHHADLANREYWGATFLTANDACGNCDIYTHGTLVAGIIAGNRATAVTDTNRYYNGQGIAPYAGIFSTKIFGNAATTGNIFNWASDATSNGVTIQNHSHNDYNASPSSSGRYTLESRQYDLATRDSDNNAANGLTPILFTVSAGNIDQEPATNQVLPPATAKNVISMGGAENYRPAWVDPALPCHGAFADDFRNIFSNSRRGTATSGYIKPDLVAPATIDVTTRTTYQPTNPRYTDCYDNFDGNWLHTAESGTSFAAPVAAGAALLIKRYFGSSPSDTTPALAKAVLIANSRSIRDGVDHFDSSTVGPLPNLRQGFGRLTLERLFTTWALGFEQSPNRHFTTSGQTWRTRLTVNDTSKPVTVALVWTDAAGAALATNPLVNDLDLSIVPSLSTCTYMQGNVLAVNDTNKGEESVAYSCSQNAPLDSVNNVEYARFFPSGYTQFDVVVTAHAITQPADPGFSSGNNQDFVLAVMNANLVNNADPIAPVLTAHRDATSPYSVDLNWTPAVNLLVDHYTINRGSTLSNVAPTASTTTQTTFTDSRPSAINTWVYSVTASSTSSPPVTVTSNTDYATTVQFHDVPVTTSTYVLAQHITELRQAIDSILVAGGQSAATWTDSSLGTTTPVKYQHVSELRTNLATAVAPFSFTLAPYTWSLSSGQTIHAADINELRVNIK
jgi:hypothetical protein